MNHQLVFVHGRAQEHKDSIALKAEWIATFREGLTKAGRELPIAENDIRFPYYGQALYDLVAEVPQDKVAEVVVRGEGANEFQQDFMLSVLEEVRQAAGITEEKVAAAAGTDVIALRGGPLNWEWMHGILKAIDTHVPGGSGTSIALATNDVYQYLRNPGIRDTIEQGVREALTAELPTIVVSHSLGTVVAYNLLRREGADHGWNIPLFVTIGSPLAVTAVKKALQPIRHPECVSHWYNALDPRDIVALYPLDKQHFNVSPPIENKINVRNQTGNCHGIAGYLNDKDVTQKVYDALTA